MATTADLNQALGTVDNRIDEIKRWAENAIADFGAKLRVNTERIDTAEREQQTSLESLGQEIKSLRAGTVTNISFRQQCNVFEKRFEHEKDETESKLEHLKIALEKDITSSIGNLRLKAETLNANCIALTEKCKVLEETFVPSLRADLEEQKQKRLAETQRLESEIEKMKELCESKISHTAAALRFYVTATATKLREELAPATATKEIEEDVKQVAAELKKQLKLTDDKVLALAEQLSKHQTEMDSTIEKHTVELGQHTKALKVHEITVVNLQNGIASDLNDMRETVRTERANTLTELSDARASAARAAASNEHAIQAVAQEINPLRQFRELILERLHVEQFVNLVRDWQSGLIPQINSTVKDLEDRVKKVQQVTQKDHDLLVELKNGHTAIRGHFKMFHAIASGLDDKGEPTAPLEDSRLPPISSGRTPRTPPV